MSFSIFDLGLSFYTAPLLNYLKTVVRLYLRLYLDTVTCVTISHRILRVSYYIVPPL